MTKTLVIQSHREPLPYPWLQTCIDSVRNWAKSSGFEYEFLDDALFDFIRAPLRTLSRHQPVIASDLARLYWIQDSLAHGYDRVIWCDADFLVFDPESLQLIGSDFALGREVWVQNDKRDGLRIYKKVHNAFLMFHRENNFLAFYLDTAVRLLQQNQGSMPPQFIGPKLLTALHNIANFPVQENAGMLSPLVIRDLLAGGGKALDLMLQKSVQPLAGANLSASLVEQAGLNDRSMGQLISRLLREPMPLFTEPGY